MCLPLLMQSGYSGNDFGHFLLCRVERIFIFAGKVAEMKRKEYIWLIGGIVAVLLGVVCAFMAGRYYYDAHVSSFKDAARQELVRVLEQELVKREDMKQSIWSNRSQRVLSREEMVKDTVRLILPEIGERAYAIPPHRRTNNLEALPEYRVAQSFILSRSPLSADTLLHAWQKLVAGSGFRLSLRVGVTDYSEKETFSYVGDTAHLADADSLFSCYLGMRSEVEVTGFARYVWHRMFTAGEWCMLFFLFFVAAGLMMAVIHFRWVFRVLRTCGHKLFPSFISLPEEKLVVLGLTFRQDSCLLKGEKGSRKLNPQLTCLFLLFAQAEKNQVPKTYIMERLWPNGNRTDHSLHSVISRLRRELHACGEADILDMGVAYKLCRPKEDETITSAK